MKTGSAIYYMVILFIFGAWAGAKLADTISTTNTVTTKELVERGIMEYDKKKGHLVWVTEKK